MQASRISNKLPICADDPMTGNDDADRVAIVGHSHRTRGARLPYRLGQFRVASSLPIGDITKSAPNLLLEIGTRRFKGQIEFLAPTSQKLLKLIGGKIRKRSCPPLPRKLAITEENMGDGLAVGGNRQPAQRCVVDKIC